MSAGGNTFGSGVGMGVGIGWGRWVGWDEKLRSDLFTLQLLISKLPAAPNFYVLVPELLLKSNVRKKKSKFLNSQGSKTNIKKTSSREQTSVS